jgi:aryl-alcohol dehydrogenase-like predicted oxidoreductase
VNVCGNRDALIPRRPFGRDGQALSILGMGGIVLMNAEPGHAARIVAEAVERGVNYFDVSPSYGDAELKLGPALAPFRERVFLASKTGRRDAEGARAHLAASLQRLQTDSLDLYQLHSLTDVAGDVDAVFARGGAMEALEEARRDGRVRHLGFSAHSVEAALAALDRYDWDSVLFPLNFACWIKNGFGPEVVERARERGVTVLALKAMARSVWPEEHPQRGRFGKCWYLPLADPELGALALRWTLSLPVAAAVSPGEEELFRVALEAARDFRPLTDVESERLRTLAAGLTPIFPQ